VREQAGSAPRVNGRESDRLENVKGQRAAIDSSDSLRSDRATALVHAHRSADFRRLSSNLPTFYELTTLKAVNLLVIASSDLQAVSLSFILTLPSILTTIAPTSGTRLAWQNKATPPVALPTH
jgi:hypothetical protein